MIIRVHCKPLILYQDKQYRVYRDRDANLRVEQGRSYSFSNPDGTREECKGWFEISRFYPYQSQYRWATRKNKLALNKEYTVKGIDFINHWKQLLDQGIWEVRCENWDGLGTPCPIQIERDGAQLCPIRFSYMGYGGGLSSTVPCPGKCPGPLNHSALRRICAPTTCDEYGISMHDLAKIRYDIRERCNVA